MTGRVCKPKGNAITRVCCGSTDKSALVYHYRKDALEIYFEDDRVVRLPSLINCHPIVRFGDGYIGHGDDSVSRFSDDGTEIWRAGVEELGKRADIRSIIVNGDTVVVFFICDGRMPDLFFLSLDLETGQRIGLVKLPPGRRILSIASDSFAADPTTGDIVAITTTGSFVVMDATTFEIKRHLRTARGTDIIIDKSGRLYSLGADHRSINIFDISSDTKIRGPLPLLDRVPTSLLDGILGFDINSLGELIVLDKYEVCLHEALFVDQKPARRD